MHRISVVVSATIRLLVGQQTVAAQEAVSKKLKTEFIWPDLAPGETDRNPGEALPMRPTDNPPITRLINIRRPSIDVYEPTGNPNGAAVLIYADLKRSGVPAELHIYETGGHGYGSRPQPNSNIGTWKDRAIDWLERRL